MNIDSMTPDQFNALPQEQQMALLDGGSLEEPQQEAPVIGGEQNPQGVATPEVAPAPQPSAEAQPGQEQERRGNPEVPLRQLREENRQLTAQLQQVMTYLQQQQAQGQPQQQAPELAIEDPEAIGHLIANHPMVQQLMQSNHQMQAILQQSQQREQMANLRQQYPDIDQTTAEFDSQYPQAAGNYDPVAKHLMMQGIKANDPQAMQAKIDAAAASKAEQMVAQALAAANKSGKQVPVTLGGLPPAQSHEQQPDINTVSSADFDKMSDADIRKMRANF